MPKNDLKGDLVIDGRFEWWSKKDEANIVKRHYSFKEKILALQVSYTETERIHIISARDATPKEREAYFERLRRIYR